MSEACLKLLLVDDEPLARERLRSQLEELLPSLATQVVGEAASGQEALAKLATLDADVVLSDIRMPGMDGIELATHLAQLARPPAIIFTTAYDNYAVQAFELNAVDYLLKPVRAQRLLAALQKVQPGPRLPVAQWVELGQQVRGEGRTHLASHERGRLLLVPVPEILYLRADLKYVVARTQEREFLLDESLSQLEQEYPSRFLRLHRSVLVARSAVIGFEKALGDDADAYGWALLRDVPEKLPVSRRQWSAARMAALSA